jgi:hypothetical protein
MKSTSERNSSFSAGLSPVAALVSRIRSERAMERVDDTGVATVELSMSAGLC